MLMSGTTLSSGLTYKQNINKKMDLEVLYSAYDSFYLLTSNITQIGIHAKYRLIQFGPFYGSIMAGPGLYYSPNIGTSITVDWGGVMALKPNNDFAVSLPIIVSSFSDGMWINMMPGASYILPFANNYELFGGYRVNVQMIGGDATSGQMTSYITLGLRGKLN